MQTKGLLSVVHWLVKGQQSNLWNYQPSTLKAFLRRPGLATDLYRKTVRWLHRWTLTIYGRRRSRTISADTDLERMDINSRAVSLLLQYYKQSIKLRLTKWLMKSKPVQILWRHCVWFFDFSRWQPSAIFDLFGEDVDHLRRASAGLLSRYKIWLQWMH